MKCATTAISAQLVLDKELRSNAFDACIRGLAYEFRGEPFDLVLVAVRQGYASEAQHRISSIPSGGPARLASTSNERKQLCPIPQ